MSDIPETIPTEPEQGIQTEGDEAPMNTLPSQGTSLRRKHGT